MNILFRRLLCRFTGHPTVPTGRRAFSLAEEFCPQCERMFVSSKEHPGSLLPTDPEFERIILDHARRYPELIQAASTAGRSEAFLAHRGLAPELPDVRGQQNAPADVQWMPPGIHTIEASKGGKPVTKKVTVNAATAATMQAVLASMNAAADRNEGDRPYFDFNHEEGPASAHPTEFYWAGDDPKTGGVRAKVEWTEGGKTAVLGRAWRRFSPAFFADDNGIVTGAPENMGGLVNTAAFQKISPLWSRQTDPERTTQQQQQENTQNMKSLIALLARQNVVTSAEVDEATAISQLTTYLAAQLTQKTELETIKGHLTKAREDLVRARKTHAEKTVAGAIKAGRIPSKDDALKARWTSLIEADPANEDLLPEPNPALQEVVKIEGRDDVTRAKKTGAAKVHPFIAKAREIRKADANIKTEADALAICARQEPGLYEEYREALQDGKLNELEDDEK